LNISGSRRDAEECPPHTQSRQGIVNLGLREQSLRFGYCVDIPQARLIAGGRLLQGRSRSRHLHRCITSDAAGAIEICHCPIPLRTQIDCELLGSCRLGSNNCTPFRFTRAKGWQVRIGKVTLKPSA